MCKSFLAKICSVLFCFTLLITTAPHILCKIFTYTHTHIYIVSKIPLGAFGGDGVQVYRYKCKCKQQQRTLAFQIPHSPVTWFHHHHSTPPHNIIPKKTNCTCAHTLYAYKFPYKYMVCAAAVWYVWIWCDMRLRCVGAGKNEQT